MKNKLFIWLSLTVAVSFITIIMISCNKTFDEPPVFVDANIPVTTTIKAIKATHTLPSAMDAIKGDQVIAGIVICDDKSGNYYKQIAIQDSTGGLLVRLDAANLYTRFFPLPRCSDASRHAPAEFPYGAARGGGCGHVDDALARTGAVRGQRCALPTARAFDHMPTAFYQRR